MGITDLQVQIRLNNARPKLIIPQPLVTPPPEPLPPEEEEACLEVRIVHACKILNQRLQTLPHLVNPIFRMYGSEKDFCVLFKRLVEKFLGFQDSIQRSHLDISLTSLPMNLLYKPRTPLLLFHKVHDNCKSNRAYRISSISETPQLKKKKKKKKKKNSSHSPWAWATLQSSHGRSIVSRQPVKAYGH